MRLPQQAGVQGVVEVVDAAGETGIPTMLDDAEQRCLNPPFEGFDIVLDAQHVGIDAIAIQPIRRAPSASIARAVSKA